jgi:thiol-disulfide isomerase/thioredoxin
MSAPAYEELSKNYSTVTFLEANVEDNDTLAAEFAIRSVPTFIVFKKGEKGARLDGFNKAQLEELLRALTNKEATKTTFVTEVPSAEEFRKTIANGKVIVKFYRNTCGFCQLIAPEYERIASTYNNSIKCIAVDTEKFPEFVQEYAAEGVPAFFAFRDGKQVDHFIGAVKSELERMAKDLSAAAPVPNLATETEEQPAPAANGSED